ncbi:hypothetical protein EPA93_14535 [Ktedonosporobacter rubrisoli]|uniref:Uncharacterized protein n=1 Tax=Ktedonosporobacter rubrisoli TaxID=2509675 RepID=A0A4P6JP58_KTERU|nr:hypothetical protein [Ktedonosporobacter rubrisoli]QBD77149.1 hypothetical protein EPA93_14535 [Ktedonosporobacter rubrisoli]
MLAARIISIIAGIAGLGALALGLAYWFAQINLIPFHMLFGLIVTLTLLILAILALFNKELRLLGIVGVVYALIVPALGLTQTGLLTGNLHWIIRSVHLLVGLGALALIGLISMRYIALKQTKARVAERAQVVR